MCNRVHDRRKHYQPHPGLYRPERRMPENERRIGDRRTRDLQDLLDTIRETEAALEAYIDNILIDAGINPKTGEELNDG